MSYDLFNPPPPPTPDPVAEARARIDELRRIANASPEDRERMLAERDDAVEQVYENNQEWVDTVALPFIRDYLVTHSTMFVDDLWESGLKKPREPKALGAAIRRAAASGWAEKTGDHRISAGNSNPKPIWASLIFGKPIKEEATNG